MPHVHVHVTLNNHKLTNWSLSFRTYENKSLILRTFVFSECNWLFWSGRFYGFWWVVQLLKSSCSLKTLKRCPRGHARVNLFLEKSYIHTVLESGSHGQPDAWQFWSCRKSRYRSESRWQDNCLLGFFCVWGDLLRLYSQKIRGDGQYLGIEGLLAWASVGISAAGFFGSCSELRRWVETSVGAVWPFGRHNTWIRPSYSRCTIWSCVRFPFIAETYF